MTTVARPRTSKAVLFGALALVLFTAVAAAGGYWWNERNQPSQASKTDCLLAQKLVDSAQHIPSDKAAIAKWEKSAQQRRYQLDDGYLGASISNYEALATISAKGESKDPQNKRVRQLQDQANSHCSDANVTLVFPPFAS
ncbi:hypothetical protein [Streptomyces sp. NPDC094149]|uniref:hypothetical protein n=1 Tax=Streptomyces sp. NPDC094149 TaxID=3155079 RepID=UPI00332AF539